MLDVCGPTVSLHCTPDGLVLQRRTRFGRECGAPVVRVLSDQSLSSDQFQQQMCTQLRSAFTELACTGARVDIIVADAWCRFFLTTPPVNVANRTDLDAAVAVRFQSLYGESAAEWLLRSDAQVAASFVTVALPQALQRGLLDVADTCELAVVRIAPACIVAWNRWRRAVKVGDWFAQLSDKQMTLMVLDGTQVRHIVQQPLDAMAWHDPDWLTRCVEREALRLNLPLPVKVACAGQVPPTWASANADAARPRCHILAEKNCLAPAKRSVTEAAESIE